MDLSFETALRAYVAKVSRRHLRATGTFSEGVVAVLLRLDEALLGSRRAALLRARVAQIASDCRAAEADREQEYRQGRAMVARDLELALAGWHVDPDWGVRDVWSALAFCAAADTVTAR